MIRRLEEPMATQRANCYLLALPAFNSSGQLCLSGRCPNLLSLTRLRTQRCKRVALYFCIPCIVNSTAHARS